jgi:hypothetical protein
MSRLGVSNARSSILIGAAGPVVPARVFHRYLWTERSLIPQLRCRSCRFEDRQSSSTTRTRLLLNYHSWAGCADYSIGKPVIAIGDRKGLLACFANRVSRRSNMVTDDFVDGLTSRTDVEGGGRCDGHGRLIDHCIIDSTAARASKAPARRRQKFGPTDRQYVD